MPNTPQSISELFKIREKFIVIGLTGRTGSGCTTTAQLLSKSNFTDIKAPTPQSGEVFLDTDNRTANEERKYKILHSYAEKHWQEFHLIKVRDVIASFILESEFDEFVNFTSETLSLENAQKSKLEELFYSEIKDIFADVQVKLKSIKTIEDIRCESPERLQEAYDFYFKELKVFTDKLNKVLKKLSQDIFIKLYQAIGDNIRSSGNALKQEFNPVNIHAIAERVNLLIKILNKQAKDSNAAAFIVIDALRNPFESQFFKERYSAFYLVAVNTPEESRRYRLQNTLDLNPSQIKDIDEKEYPKKLKGNKRFVSQNIQKCIEIADIHINNPQEETLDRQILKRQLIWYVALIMHPGLVIPTATERAMQIALTAKLNSGCISRQVGAVVTDKYYSVKAVGWNNTPEGQVPCILRNVEDLIKSEDRESFSGYELTNSDFRNLINNVYENKISNKEGRNISYCFKDLQNSLDGEKNQVHTRSLHAEENAFLQISKYGGQGVLDGNLFTTASPCELCAKKAYQLGIRKIIYIDPYPGITTSHILAGGTRKIELELFSGAIGKAYHQLYQAFLPYKDELNILFNISLPIKDKQSEEITKLKKQIEELKKELANINEIQESKDEPPTYIG